MVGEYGPRTQTPCYNAVDRKFTHVKIKNTWIELNKSSLYPSDSLRWVKQHCGKKTKC